MTNNHARVTGDPRADFGMPISGQVRVWSPVSALGAFPLATATVVAKTEGDFSGFHAWSPPS